MKKPVIFLVVLSLTITLLTATPARAHDDFFWPLWPLYAVGVGTAAVLSGTAAIVGSVFSPPIDYYPDPPVVYGGGYEYYGRPAYGYHGGYYRGYYGGHRGGYQGGNYRGYHREYYGGHRGEYHGGNHGGGYRR
jgi:hypothetical protein